MTQDAMWWAALCLWVGGLIFTAAYDTFYQRRKPDGDSNIWLMYLIPLLWFLWPMYFFEVHQNVKEIKLDLARQAKLGSPSLTPAVIHQRRKAWDKRYKYLSEVAALSPDFVHPDPDLGDPPFPDPAGVRDKDKCPYPRPSIRRETALVKRASTTQEAEDRNKLEASFGRDTDELIERIDTELSK